MLGGERGRPVDTQVAEFSREDRPVQDIPSLPLRLEIERAFDRQTLLADANNPDSVEPDHCHFLAQIDFNHWFLYFEAPQ